MSNSEDWSSWAEADLEQRMFNSQPGSVNHQKAKYILEKRRHEKEMAKKVVLHPSIEPGKGSIILRRLLGRGREILSQRPIDADKTYEWVNTTRELVVNCFGPESRNVSGFDEQYAATGEQAHDRRDEINASVLRRELALLQSCLEQLELLSEAASPVSAMYEEPYIGTGIFLVHGHNEGQREAVARFLEKLKLPVTIPHEKPDMGRTVIEKFSDHARTVGFAVVLLTADDRGGPRDKTYQEQQPRARQNVLFELGLFIGKLGRDCVCALFEEGVEVPSDYAGVIFVPIDKGGAWRTLLAREIKAAGIPVDVNLVA